ncbi:MAG: hypothetical protein HN849_07290 [Victivallales bacterium]|nr:hypothetical protein [Victivallales bacterium]
MMKRSACAWFGLLVSVMAAEKLPVEFERAGWEPRPSFLPNATSRPEVVHADGVTTLRVIESGKGMKFSLPLEGFRTADRSFLVFRYKARNLAGGYALWLYDGVPGGHMLVNVNKLRQDGEWQVAAIDLFGTGAKGLGREFLTEVQCRDEAAWIAFDWIRLADEPPDGAQVFGAVKVVPDAVLRPATMPGLKPQPRWLSYQSPEFSAQSEAEGLHLRVTGAGKGMKWSLPLPKPLDLEPYRYAAVRYRARGVRRYGDYLVWLADEAGGVAANFRNLISLTDVQSDDQWRVAIVPLAKRFPVVEIAVQNVSEGESSDIWLDEIRFSVRRPRYAVAKLCSVKRLAAMPEGFAAVPLGVPAVKGPARSRHYSLVDWFADGVQSVHGIPFAIADGKARELSGMGSIELPVGQTAGELYVLMAAEPPEMDYARMSKGKPMISFANPERFRFAVVYEDGVRDEIFPASVGTRTYEVKRGLDVYVLGGLRDAPIQKLEVVSCMESARFLVGGVTANSDEPRTALPAVLALPSPVDPVPEAAGAGSVSAVAGGFYIENDLIEMTLTVGPGLQLKALSTPCLFGEELKLTPGSLFEVGMGDTTVTSAEITVGKPVVTNADGLGTLTVPIDARPQGVPLAGEFVAELGEKGGIRLRLNLRNVGEKTMVPRVRFPLVRDIRMGSVEETWYLYARKGGVISNRPFHERKASGGEYPLQVLDVFRADGGGVAMLTEDTVGSYRFWELAKDEQGVDIGIDYWEREYAPGEALETVPTVLRAHTGDWRRALALYREWVRTWYRAQSPRQPWMQDVYYYQQTVIGRIRDRQTGAWRIPETIQTYRDYFGCLDYLHIFDFGASPTYGRVGDYSHYEENGGLAGMQKAFRQVQDSGVRLGLYMEGYLCDERSVWGRDRVSSLDIRKQDGKPLLWPGTPSEHMMCTATAGWREHLAKTYQRVAGELKPDGLYIDQHGFTNTWKTCWSREHGHPVPYAPLIGERDTGRAIRAGVPQGMVTITEEVPNDINSQYQDAALGYSVAQADPAQSPHRIDLFRFAFPDFKVFQLTQYNPFVEGGWQRLKFPFLNGEGYWLHGMTSRTYCEDAHQFLRAAFRILHENAAAFRSTDVHPLVATRAPLVYANEFRAKDRIVWTFFNAGYQTHRGPVLRLPHQPGRVYTDAFRQTAVETKIRGKRRPKATLSLELGPRAVGCIVARSAEAVP